MAVGQRILVARRTLFAGLALALGFAQAARAAEPGGEWLVADKTAQIRIADCDGTLWGFVSWEADPGVDARNPDPKMRTRPTRGMPILLGMKPTGPGRWDGAIYNSQNGKTYSGGVSMTGNDGLRVRGCILGFLCGGETWTRGDPARPGALTQSDAALCAGLPEKPGDPRRR